jgi:hypothetical protein
MYDREINLLPIPNLHPLMVGYRSMWLPVPCLFVSQPFLPTTYYMHTTIDATRQRRIRVWTFEQMTLFFELWGGVLDSRHLTFRTRFCKCVCRKLYAICYCLLVCPWATRNSFFLLPHSFVAGNIIMREKKIRVVQ